MGTSSSTEQNIEVDGVLLAGYIDKYNNTIEELASVKNQVSVLQNMLSDKESQLDVIMKNKQKELEKQVEQWNAMEYNKTIDLQVKYQSLVLDKQKLVQNLNQNNKKIDDLNRQNSNLQAYNIRLQRDLKHEKSVYEKDIIQLKGLLNDMQQKMNNVELENKELQTSNYNMKNDLETVTENRSVLKENIHRRKQAITRYKSTIANLEDELCQYQENLKELKEKLAKETVTDKTLRNIIQIHRRMEELLQVISTKRDVLLKKIKENCHCQKENSIDKLKFDYDARQAELESKNIVIDKANFIDIYAAYKHSCQRNDNRKKDVLKQMETFYKDSRQICRNFSEHLDEEVDKMPKFKDLDIKSFMQCLTVHEELYDKVWKLGKEEIAYREEILQINLRYANTDNSVRRVNRCNILNNGRLDNTSQTPEEDNNNNYSWRSRARSTSNNSTGVILFGVRAGDVSEYQDQSLISDFLAENGIGNISFTCRRLKKGKRAKKPLVVEFTNETIVEKVMELSKQRDWFLGYNPVARLYVNKN